MTAKEHDRMIAVTSNLPYLLAVGLMRLATKEAESDEDLWNLIGGSFKGATRVAASSPELTLDMFLTNRKSILKAVDGVIAELHSLRELIEKGDEQALKDIIEKVAAKARSIRSE
jgi:prephenate dehydrogenase